MIKIEIKSVFGYLLFTHESENNTIKETLLRANLRGVNLEGADLRGVNLEGANLLRANLLRADLRGANLEGAENKHLAALPQFCKWSHGIKGNLISIGCKEKNISDWETFFNSDLEFGTPRGSEDFKQIQAIFESYKAYLNFLAK